LQDCLLPAHLQPDADTCRCCACAVGVLTAAGLALPSTQI
jgi:hypothetical protein